MSVEWREVRRWLARGDNFTVEVAHENLAMSRKGGMNRWNVYAYIYPSHPHFGNFSGDDWYQDAAMDMPLHGGPTFFMWNRTSGSQTVQVGCDYCHLHDDSYERASTREEAYGVFDDAERLFRWLENYPKSKSEHIDRVENRPGRLS